MSKNILIVDDAVFMRTILRGILERAGYTIAGEAQDGKKALEKYRELSQGNQKPDLVLLDITMPEMDGLTALKELKKYDDDVRVIMCSSLTSQHIVVEAIQSGAKNFISKPFNEEKVLDVIRKYLP
jgi:two-component system chemotaxis response regulator CheY